MPLRILYAVVFCLSFLYINKLNAQHHQTPPADSSISGQKDVGDIYRHIFFKNKPEKPDTVLYIPGKVYPSIFPGLGYAQLTRFTFLLTANFAFYTNKGDSANLSLIHTGVEYSQNRQFFPLLITNIWSKGNKYNFVGDIRYFNYSEYTYGLGSNSKTENPSFFDFNFIRIYQMALKRVGPDFLVGLGYNLDYHWNIRNANATPNFNDDYYIYNARHNYDIKKTISSGLSLNVLFDSRRNINNPVAGGSFANIILRQNMKVLGSNQNWASLYFDVRKYISFPRGSKNILAFWHFDWLTPYGNAPYLDMPSNGWDTYDNSSRNFIQGRYRGKNMLYLESEYRFGILKNRFLGGAVYANVASYSERDKNNFIGVAQNVGVSLRIKVNKHSNTNLIVSYGVGKGWQNGFFFNLGETF